MGVNAPLEHRFQSGSACNTARQPHKQCVCGYTACCSTLPAATTAITSIPTTAAAAASVASRTTIVVTPVLGLHMSFVTGAMALCSWYGDVELLANFVEKFGKDDTAVSDIQDKRRRQVDMTYC